MSSRHPWSSVRVPGFAHLGSNVATAGAAVHTPRSYAPNSFAAIRGHRTRAYTLRIALAGALGLSLTAGGVYAALNAQAFNSTPQAVSSGTLKLTLADNGSGFTQAVTNLAPSDVVIRYVDLSASGSLDGRVLKLAVADANATKLTTDATNGLRVTVTSCTGATWNPTTGACGAGGTTAPVLSNQPLASLVSAPTTLSSGSVAAGSALHLQMALTLPDQTETTTNGTLPAGTIQGLSSSLTWTFSDTQRAGTSTTS